MCRLHLALKLLFVPRNVVQCGPHMMIYTSRDNMYVMMPLFGIVVVVKFLSCFLVFRANTLMKKDQFTKLVISILPLVY